MLSWLFGKRQSRPVFEPADLLEIPSKYFDEKSSVTAICISPRIAASVTEAKVFSGHGYKSPPTWYAQFNMGERQYLFCTKYYPTSAEAVTAMRELLEILRNHARGLPIRIVVHPWQSKQAA